MRVLLVGSVLSIALAAGFAPAVAPATSASLDVDCSLAGHASLFATPMWWVGGGGQFALASQTAACTGQHNLAPEVRQPLYINALETFDNVVCGTATFHGSATVADSTGTLANASITMTIANGHGRITGNFDGVGPWAGERGSVEGSVSMTPNTLATQPTHGGTLNHSEPPPPTSNICVDNYAVDASFSLTG